MKQFKFFIVLVAIIFFSETIKAQSSDFSGKYQLDMQFVQLKHEGGNKYIAVFSEDCELTTKIGTVNKNGVLEIPFEGENQMQTMFIKKMKNQIKIWNSNNSPMMQKCNGATLVGTYEKREMGQSSDFSGKYQLDMQFVQLIHKGGNKYSAIFSEDCDLTTKMGMVKNGVLEIPFEGESRMQTMFIKKSNNGIKIWNSNNSPMMQKCNGATLAGTYQKR